VNNHIFFQHPDLIRILRVHENVMALMMNTLGRAQVQSEAQGAPSPGGEGTEQPAKEKVVDIKHKTTLIKKKKSPLNINIYGILGHFP